MKLTKQLRRLRASNAVHKRLQKLNNEKYKKTLKDEYQQMAICHGACVIRQEKSGRCVYSCRARKSL